MHEQTITLKLHEATTGQLLAALSQAVESGRRCEAQGTTLHTWDTRADAIRVVLEARSKRAPASRDSLAPKEDA